MKKTGGKIAATAKLEASAKVGYQRKKTIIEVVPEDVSRAKSKAWLDLISPITEWAGLKGDQLRHKRNLLRIQQEETLVRVAKQVRKNLLGIQIVHPVAAKILVPALENASLESPSDDEMINKWAQLLSSSAAGHNVHPRFVRILSELEGRQAKALESLVLR
jgi:hypothetical protein